MGSFAKISTTASTPSPFACRLCVNAASTSRFSLNASWRALSVAQGLPPDSKTLSRDAMDLLTTYAWPGNIRELESTVSRAALSSPGRVIPCPGHRVPEPHAVAGSTGWRTPCLAADAERAHIARVLEAVHWNKKEAARARYQPGTLCPKDQQCALEADRDLRRRATA